MSDRKRVTISSEYVDLAGLLDGKSIEQLLIDLQALYKKHEESINLGYTVKFDVNFDYDVEVRLETSREETDEEYEKRNGPNNVVQFGRK